MILFKNTTFHVLIVSAWKVVGGSVWPDGQSRKGLVAFSRAMVVAGPWPG